MTLPTKEDFATEVRSDRLALVWKVTLATTLVFLVGLLLAGITAHTMANQLMPPITVTLSLVAGCLAARSFLALNRFQFAVWAYALGGVFGAIILMATGDTQTMEIVPFIFPVIIFMVGLMLPPSSSLSMAVLAGLVLLLVPLVRVQTVGVHQLFAILFTFLSAILSAQVTGELYQITEWALHNYQRERRTNDELFQKRQELQRTLKRSEALSEKLQETNSELEIARAAAEEAKHFRGQFLANMSHELRTPLNAIIGFSETMLRFPLMYDEIPLPNEYNSDINQIYSSGRQLLTVINDILDLAKVDAGRLEVIMERVDPEPIINGVVSTAHGLLGSKTVELKKDIPSPAPLLWADESRLRQVLLNLYSNAAKFTETGSITLKVRETEQGVMFSVQDTGIGIPSGQLESIFEEFRQAESGKRRDPRAGAGLGLAISRQLMNLMGGRIWAQSELGKGSTFHFIVQPYHEQDKTQQRRPPSQAEKEIQTVNVPSVSSSKG